jgi:vancomycin permeability regulator SanA
VPHLKFKKKRILKIILFLMGLSLTGLLLLFGINGYVKASVKNRIITMEEAAKLKNIDCILILGAGITDENQPTNMLEDRLKYGIQLYEEGASNRLLMSGDHGQKEYDEVNVMKRYAMDAGIPSSDIFMDHAGFSTYESLYRAREVFQAHKIIIVTQKYHLYRAMYVGKKLGLEVYGVASDPRQYAGQSYRDSREILARAKDFAYAIVKPKPTYLGDAIPVYGNGDITND